MSAFCTQVLRYNVLLNWDNKTNALKFACIVLLFIFILKAKYKIYSFPVVSCGSFPDALWNSSLPSQYNFLWEHSLFLPWSTLIWIFFFSSRDIDSLSSISPGCLTFDHQQCPCLCVNYRKAFTWFWDHTWCYLYSVILNECLMFGSFLSLLIRLPNNSRTFVGKVLTLLKQFLPCFTEE